MNDILVALSQSPSIRCWKSQKVTLQVNGAWLEYGVKGMADISGILKHSSGLGLRLEIEAKTGSASQSKDQKNFEKMVRSLGGIYFVARSVQDALDFCDRAANL